MVTRTRLAQLAPSISVGLFVALWVAWEVLAASKNPVPGWDGMVNWINGQAYSRGAVLYEYSRPPALPLFLALVQSFGMPLAYSYVLQPILTGLSGLILYLILRNYVRDWLAALGTTAFLCTAIVEYWSSTLLTHGFATAFLLGAFYTLNNYSFKRMILGASFLSLAILTSFPLVLLVVPMFLLYALRYRRLIDFDALTLGGILPLVPFLVSFPSGLFDISRQIAGTIFNRNSLLVAGLSQPASPHLYFDWIATNLLFLLPLLAVGVYAVFDKRKAWIFGLWMIVYLFGLTVFSDREQRLVFELTPALVALVVIGGEHILRNVESTRRRALVGVVLLILISGYAVNQTLFVLPQVQASSRLGVTSAELRSLQIIGIEIQNHTLPGDVVVAEHDAPWLSYYSSRYVYIVQLTDLHDPATVRNTLASLSPHPVLLVAAPALGDDIGFLGSLNSMTLVGRFDAPSWGAVYMYRVTMP